MAWESLDILKDDGFFLLPSSTTYSFSFEEFGTSWWSLKLSESQILSVSSFVGQPVESDPPPLKFHFE